MLVEKRWKPNRINSIDQSIINRRGLAAEAADPVSHLVHNLGIYEAAEQAADTSGGVDNPTLLRT
jgi:hypothetical protein